MKSKKGFTLIELLAVIVILAIIALIAVPVILNMINGARKSAAKSAALGYIDAIEYSNGFYAIGSDVGVTGYQKITSGDVSTINTKLGSHLKGKAPTSGSVVIDTNGKVTSATLCISGYTVTYENNDVSNVTSGCSSSNNNNNEPSIPEPESFATDSWETIANNTTSSLYQPGQTKTIQMDIDGDNTPETYTLRIANIESCPNTVESETACDFVIEFVDLLNISTENYRKYNYSSSNSGGWRDSKIREYLNTLKDSNENDISVYSKLPNNLKNVIKTTKVISGYNKTGTEDYETYDKLYLLSPKEVGVDKEIWDSANSKTRTLKYYDGKENNDRIKFSYGTTTASDWWLRAVYSNNTSSAWFVSSDGYCYDNNASNQRGVAPAFRIGVSS